METQLATTDEALDLTGLRMGDIHNLADAFKESGLFPDIEKTAQAIVKVVAGQELGLPPVYSMQNFYIIKGKLSMAAEVMGLLLKRSGQYDYDVIAHSDQACQIQFKQKVTGEWKPTYSSTFTIQDAQRAGLVRQGGNWIMYPKAMLFSRAMSQGARIVAPHLLGGARTIEEAESITPDTTVEIEPAPEPEKAKDKRRKKAQEVIDKTTLHAVETPVETEQPPEVEGSYAVVATESDSNSPPPANPAETTTETPPSATEVTLKRDPATVKDLNDMYKALYDDYGLQPAQVMKELGVKSNLEIHDMPADCYRQVAAVYISREGNA